MWFDAAHHAWQKFLGLIFPVRCLGCGRGEDLLCWDCAAILPMADNDKPDCRARYAYSNETVRKAIWKLKYKHIRDLADVLGRGLGELLLEDLPDLEEFEGLREPVLVPVPLSPGRLRERGYNQAELIAQAVAAVTNLPLLTQAIAKTRETPPQVSRQSHTERLKNLTGAFSVANPTLVKNKNVILIDDVYTTGATAGEIARVLKLGGARRVLTYTVAH